MRTLKTHPKFRDLKISNDGSQFLLLNEPLEIKDHETRNNRVLKVVSINGTRFSVPKLILETYGPPKPDDSRHYAQSKDGNIENIHPNNLFWSKSHQIPEKRKFKNSLKLSKLTKKQTEDSYTRHKIEGEKLSSIAFGFGVSETTIARAVKRYEKFINSIEVNL